MSKSSPPVLAVRQGDAAVPVEAGEGADAEEWGRRQRIEERTGPEWRGQQSSCTH